MMVALHSTAHAYIIMPDICALCNNTSCGPVCINQNYNQLLYVYLELSIENSPDAPFIVEGKLRVKLTGDGTNIGKYLHVNFTFTILEGDRAHGATGNHCIAIFKESESYDAMKLPS